MSHFTVLVKVPKERVDKLGLDEAAREQLAPYQENNMGDCPPEFMEFNDAAKDEWYLNYWEEHKEDSEYSSLEEFLIEGEGFEQDPETGKIGYWENPNAKWDWYQVGGRWTGQLLLKEEAVVAKTGVRGQPSLLAVHYHPDSVNTDPHMADAAQFKDVDWKAMNKSVKEEVRKFVEQVQQIRAHQATGADNLPDGTHPLFGPWQAMVELGIVERTDPEGDWSLQKFHIKNLTFEEAMERYASYWKWRTWAVIDEEGRWHEKATMGWWGMHDGDPDDVMTWCNFFWHDFIEGTDPETWVVVVDCHI